MFKPEVEDIVIIKEEKLSITEVDINSYGDGVPIILLENGNKYKICEDAYEAGEKAKEYWEDFAWDEPHEFIEYIGADQIIDWAMGIGGNLNDWLDEWEHKAAKHFAIDDNEVDAEYIGWEYKGEVVLYLQEEGE